MEATTWKGRQGKNAEKVWRGRAGFQNQGLERFLNWHRWTVNLPDPLLERRRRAYRPRV